MTPFGFQSKFVFIKVFLWRFSPVFLRFSFINELSKLDTQIADTVQLTCHTAIEKHLRKMVRNFVE